MDLAKASLNVLLTREESVSLLNQAFQFANPNTSVGPHYLFRLYNAASEGD